MKFNINQQDLQQALNYCQGVIEKRSTLPILSNILLDVQSMRIVCSRMVSLPAARHFLALLL